MNLDPRIKSKNDILTCFDTKDAGQFLAQEGYFSDHIDQYRYLASRKYGILTEIKDSDCPFKEGNNEFWRFFIPESRLIEIKEKVFRPYTVAEFQNIFKPGYPVRFRPKDQSESENMLLIFNGYKTIQGAVFVYFGHFAYTLNQLFEDYEWQEHYTDDFKPFGVEE